MSLHIVKNDISLMQTDAIVNAANPYLRNGGGVTGAIFRRAGAAELEAYTKNIAPIATGKAVITPGFKLAAKYIIHAVGPVYHGGEQNEATLLESCYVEALKLAQEQGLESVAFPLISAGIYGYPVGEALRIALSCFKNFLQTHELEIYLVLFTDELTELAFVMNENLPKTS